MKRIFFLFGILLVFSMPIFAQSEQTDTNDEENQVQQDDENIVRRDDYSINGKGDQFLKIGVMGNFPLNFGDKLYVGGAASIGYYKFLNSWFGLGGELMAGYNPTLGSNVLTFLPVTFGCLFQPSVWKFEFPIFTTVGFAFETCANKKYFPGFAAKCETGAFYRITEGWSAGITGQFLYLPEWYTTTENASSDYGLFMQAGLAARYHF